VEWRGLGSWAIQIVGWYRLSLTLEAAHNLLNTAAYWTQRRACFCGTTHVLLNFG
jgi:hypothetical protein